jgi:hypothetical protein
MLRKIDMILQSEGKALSMTLVAHRLFSEGLLDEVSFMRTVGRQDCTVEREASWGITKLRVDKGPAIDVL